MKSKGLIVALLLSSTILYAAENAEAVVGYSTTSSEVKITNKKQFEGVFEGLKIKNKNIQWLPSRLEKEQTEFDNVIFHHEDTPLNTKFRFEDVHISFSTLKNITAGSSAFKQLVLLNSKLDTCIFTASKFDSCTFIHTYLQSCNMSNATISNSTFTDITYESVDWSGSHFKDVKFIGVLSVDKTTKWTHATFSNVNFIRADIQGSLDLRKATITKNSKIFITPEQLEKKAILFTEEQLKNGQIIRRRTTRGSKRSFEDLPESPVSFHDLVKKAPPSKVRKSPLPKRKSKKKVTFEDDQNNSDSESWA